MIQKAIRSCFVLSLKQRCQGTPENLNTLWTTCFVEQDQIKDDLWLSNISINIPWLQRAVILTGQGQRLKNGSNTKTEKTIKGLKICIIDHAAFDFVWPLSLLTIKVCSVWQIRFRDRSAFLERDKCCKTQRNNHFMTHLFCLRLLCSNSRVCGGVEARECL